MFSVWTVIFIFSCLLTVSKLLVRRATTIAIQAPQQIVTDGEPNPHCMFCMFEQWIPPGLDENDKEMYGEECV